MSDAPTLVFLAPESITTDGNVRTDLGDLSDLTASIAEHGVLEPLVVTPQGDGYRVVIGHRRRAAAEAAGMVVPCVVRPDLSDLPTVLAAQIVENEHRKDLSLAERVAAYQQLSLVGLSQAKIVAATGTKAAEVKRLLGVAQSPRASAAVVGNEAVTLEQAAVLAEFEADAEAMKGLIEVLKERPGSWDHAVSRARRDRREAAMVAARVAELTGAGVTALDRVPEGAEKVWYLLDSAGKRIEDHSGCSGHVVVVSAAFSDEVEESSYCLDPVAHGHGSLRDRRGKDGQGQLSDPARKAQASEERKRVIANNKAWRAAEPVRRAFIRDLLARKTLPKGALRFAVADVLLMPNRLSFQGEEVFAELWGIPVVERSGAWAFRPTAEKVVGQVPETRLGHLLLAAAATAHETGMHVNLWRVPDGEQGRWLTFLEDCGYVMSDVERLVLPRQEELGVEVADADEPAEDEYEEEFEDYDDE